MEKKVPVFNLIVAIIFLALIFGAPFWMLITDAGPAVTLNELQQEIYGGNHYYPTITYLLLMLAFALSGLIIILFTKWFISIITGKKDKVNSFQYKAEKPKKGINVFFSSKRIDFSHCRYEDFPEKMIINTAFGSADILLPVDIAFEIRGENNFGKTLLPGKRELETGKFNHTIIPNENSQKAIEIISSCVIGKLNFTTKNKLV